MTPVKPELSRFWLCLGLTEGLTDVIWPLMAVVASPTPPPFPLPGEHPGHILGTLLHTKCFFFFSCTWSTATCLQIALHTPQLSSLKLSSDVGQGRTSQLCSTLTILTLSSFALVDLDLLCLSKLATLHLDTPKLTQVSW